MKNNDEIASALREAAQRLEPVALAELLDQLTDGGLSQGAIVVHFKQAFPLIPLRVLLDLGAWHRVGAGSLTDEQFNEALRAWTGARLLAPQCG